MNNNEDSFSSVSEAPLADTPTHGGAPHTSSVKKSQYSKRRLFILIGIALGLLLLTLAYVYWYQNPNKVVSDALGNVLNAKTVNYTGSIASTGATKMNIAVDGGVSAKGGLVNAKFVFDAQNKNYTLTGNGLFDESGNAYFKVKDIDGLVSNYRAAVPTASQPLFDKIIDKVDDKWIKVSSQDIKNYNNDFAVAQKCTGDAIKKLQNDSTVKSELSTLYKKNPFIAINKTLGAKSDSLGYSLKINHDASKAFTSDYKKTSFYKDLVKCDKSYVVEDDVAKQENDATSKGVTVDVWVSRWTHTLTRIEVRDSGQSSQTNVAFNAIFNRPVAVQVPKNSTTLEKLQNDVQDVLRSARTN